MRMKIGLLNIVVLSSLTVSAYAANVPNVYNTKVAAAMKTNAPSARSTANTEIQSPKNSAENIQTLAPTPFYTGVGISLLNDRGFTGLMPKFYVGYGRLIGNSSVFYGAVEIFGGIESLTLSTNQAYQVTGVAGLSVLPGYQWDATTLLFARLGIESAYYSKLNEAKTGGVIGVGFRTVLTSQWDMRGEYDYANNKNLNQYNVDFIYKFC